MPTVESLEMSNAHVVHQHFKIAMVRRARSGRNIFTGVLNRRSTGSDEAVTLRKTSLAWQGQVDVVHYPASSLDG